MSALLHYCTVLPANRREKLGGVDALQETVMKEKGDGQKLGATVAVISEKKICKTMYWYFL